MRGTLEWRSPGFLANLADFVLRRTCLLCGEPIDQKVNPEVEGASLLVCWRCDRQVRKIPGPTCRRCGSQASPGLRAGCRMCHRLPIGLDLVRSAAIMDCNSGRLVHRFKYQGWHSLASYLALKVLSARWSNREFWDVDLLVPVPISRTRRRERGYNQSEFLAGELSCRLGIPAAMNILKRVSWERPQVGLTYRERQANVQGAFAVRDGCRDVVSGRRIMLVDDVITTGATLGACSNALRNCGALRISAVSFGRTGIRENESSMEPI